MNHAEAPNSPCQTEHRLFCVTVGERHPSAVKTEDLPPTLLCVDYDTIRAWVIHNEGHRRQLGPSGGDIQIGIGEFAAQHERLRRE